MHLLASEDAGIEGARLFDWLVAHGKAKKLALIAVMRKRISLFNRLLKNPKFKFA